MIDQSSSSMESPVKKRKHRLSSKALQAKRRRWVGSWSNLPQDVVVHIARQVVSWEDFIAFGEVCTSWRSAAVKENFTGGGGSSTHQFPLLMIKNKKGATIREFYSLAKDKAYKLNLPEVATNLVCWASRGWLLSQSKDMKIRLLHPFKGTHIELPDNLLFKNYHYHGGRQEVSWCILFNDFVVRKFVLSSNPSTFSSGSEDCIVMVLYRSGRLAFCRLQDNDWTMIDPSDDFRVKSYHDITYYEGQFYAVDCFGNILVCDIEDPMLAKTRVVVSKMQGGQLDCLDVQKLFYLVECAGSLLVVSRYVQQINPFRKMTTGFRVFEVSLGNGNVKLEVTNLGNRTLFVGYNSSFSIDSMSYSGCKSNCICYTNARHEGIPVRDIGIFNMEQGKMESLVNSPNNKSPFPHLWVQPSF